MCITGRVATSALEAPLEAITVFVDPLDGTREFVEGRVHNVQTLVGIAVRGEARASGRRLWNGTVGVTSAERAAARRRLWRVVVLGSGSGVD